MYVCTHTHLQSALIPPPSPLSPFVFQGIRDPPRKPSTYLKGAQALGWRKVMSVVPGHWIDSGSEPGAAGEKDFNMEVSKPLTIFTLLSPTLPQPFLLISPQPFQI